ncbi:protein LLP homolog [Saccoglossus kowalevskii]|uniref:Protein LLP homolog isoform X1 n=1 Tax=Saccoglossus kowalevskii TaxID=10224 RepID=A0ABM0LU49_SACKO|nr:PREDICTED: protein LLP homolog isoform X1 [Saccoglossus kowalevskii]XP_006811290.1 PREDICTED: protein LLP homolog isoform X2 [Saccoglossus kowalevskii]
MAKSLRSKRKRKFRAMKREKIGKRNMVKMKKMLGLNEDGTRDVEMKDMYTVTTTAEVLRKKDEEMEQKRKAEAPEVKVVAAPDGEAMEVDAKKSKTLVNSHGNYPIWLSSRSVRKIKNKRQKKKKYAW